MDEVEQKQKWATERSSVARVVAPIDVFFRLDAGGAVLWASSGLDALTADEERAVRRPPRLPEGFAVAAGRPLAQALVTGSGVEFEAVVGQANGRRLYRCRVEPEPGVEGGSAGTAVMLCADVTGEWLAVEALAEVERTAEIGSWRWCPADDVVVCTADAARIMGRPARAGLLANADFRAALIPEDRAVIEARLKRIVREGGQYSSIARIPVTGSGDRLILESGRLQRDETGTWVMGTVRDVTAREQSREQERYCRRMQMLGQIAAGVSHDLDDLIATIGAFAGLLEDFLAEGTEEWSSLAQIQGAAAQASVLSRRLLKMSRGGTAARGRAVLNRVIGESGTLLRSMLGDAIVLAIELDPDLGGVEADVEEIVQILLILVINAREAMPAGGRLVVTTAAVEVSGAGDSFPDPPHLYARISVAYTGQGTPADTRDRRLESIARTGPGASDLGLGLSTLAEVVRERRGWVEIGGEPGGGTRIDVHLPTFADSEEEEPGEVAG